MYWENFKIVCRNIFRDNKEYLKILKVKPKKKRTTEEKETTETPDTPLLIYLTCWEESSRDSRPGEFHLMAWTVPNDQRRQERCSFKKRDWQTI